MDLLVTALNLLDGSHLGANLVVLRRGRRRKGWHNPFDLTNTSYFLLRLEKVIVQNP